MSPISSGAIVADGPADRSMQLNIDNSLFIRNQRHSSAGAADLQLVRYHREAGEQHLCRSRVGRSTFRFGLP